VSVHGKSLFPVLDFNQTWNELRNFRNHQNMYFMKMHKEYLHLLHEDGRTERNEETKRNIFVAFFTEPT
jgi:hypothetical protein